MGLIPRGYRLAALPTPVTAAERARAELGCAPLWVKRDDLTGFGVAGNKARALEPLLGDALDRHCDLLVTGGGPDSNFVAATALAARATGMDCELLIAGVGPTRNLSMAAAVGARIHDIGHGQRDLIDAAVDELAAARTAQGRRPVALPRGGSTPLGATGFARAAGELADQVARNQLPAPDMIVLAVGSGGGAAGLLAGLADTSLETRILGVSVSRPPEEITARVLDLARRCARRTGSPAPDPGALEIVDARGPGFGIASASDRCASTLALRTEGLLLDDTYGAKAFAVTVDRLRAGAPGPVLYWHTGGVVSALAHLADPAPDETSGDLAHDVLTRGAPT